MPKTSPHTEAPNDGITAALPLPSSSTFQLTWPAGEDPPVHSIPSAPQGAIELATHPHSSSSPNINPFFDPVPMMAADYVAEAQASSKVSTPVDESGPSAALDGLNDDPNSHHPPKKPPQLPRFSRASSTPLPAQLKHLRHPSRRNVIESPSPSPVVVAMKKSLPPPPAFAQITELAIELADSVQTVIQTLIQVSPPHLLDPAKEQLSGCTLQIPTTSVSALLTTMKNLNYMSANLSSLSTPEKTPPLETVTEEDLHVASEIKSMDMSPLIGDGEEILASNPKTLAFDDFDIGEALQSVGDVLSGISASAGVDLVLYHADVGMKHVNVRGDECGILYSISYVIRQIIAVAQPRDEIEIGLYVSSPTGARLSREYSSNGGGPLPPSPTPSTDPEEPLVCTLEITHRFASPSLVFPDAAQSPSAFQERRQPDLNTAILQNTLRHVRATLQADVTPASGSQIPNSRTYELSVLLSPGPPGSPAGFPFTEEEIKARQPFGDFKVASEPTLDELASFVAADGGLKGKKAIFHASERSSFAHHLTSYLTAWGMDVSHVPVESAAALALADGGSSTAASSVAGDLVDGTPAESESPSSKSSRSRAGSDAEVKSGSPKISTPKSETPKSGTPKLESPDGLAAASKLRQLDVAPSLLPTGSSAGLLQKPELVELAGTNFIIIDDDVNVLRRRLTQIRKAAEAKFRPQTLPQTIGNLRKRPGLQHRPRSSPSIRMASPQTQPSIPGTIEEGHSETEETTNKILEWDPLQVVILHFTSLSNYKVVQDTIYASVYAASADLGFTTHAGVYTPYPMGDMIPEVLVIPKPAGPRRFLTALHTAVRKPFIDPFFAPIATTPISPSAQFRVSPWSLPLAPGSLVPTPHGTSPASAGSATAAAVAGATSSRIVAGRQHSSGSTGSAGGSVTSSSSRLPTLASTGASESRRSPKGHPVEQQLLQHQQQQALAASIAAQAHHPTMSIPMVPMTYTGQPHMYTPHPPSPLGRDAVEYFSVNAAATQIGDSTGVLVHSPDGRPAGIFFQPQQQSRDGRRANSSAGEQQGALANGGRPQVRTQPPSYMGLDAALATVSPVVTPGAGYPPPTRFRGSPSENSALPTPTTPGRGPMTARRSTGGGEDPGRPPLARNLSSRAAVPLAQINGVPRRKTSNTGSDGGAKVTPDRPRPLQVDSTGSAVSAGGQNVRPPLVESPRTMGGPSPGLGKKIGRRSTGERANSGTLKKAKAGGDGSIVPPINVLIVEDNHINQTILSTFMKRKKINYGTAMNGQEAIDKWRAGNYHLILMDIQMPVKDGIEATKEIRTLEKERNSGIYPSTPPSEVQETAKATNVPHSPYRSSVIIVALTASEQKSDRVAALAAGCNDFLTKPVSMSWLNTKIIEWGSIKALEMFQDPATARMFNAQNAKAKTVASQLKLPPSRNPSPVPADIPDLAVVRPVLTLQAPSTPDLPTASNSEPPSAPEPQPQEAVPLSPPFSPPFSPRSVQSELSGEDALKKHVEAINEDEAKRREAVANARPVVLGEGALSSETSSTSIESVLRGIPPIAEDAVTPDTPPLPADIQQSPAVPMAPPSAPPPETPATTVEQRPAYP